MHTRDRSTMLRLSIVAATGILLATGCGASEEPKAKPSAVESTSEPTEVTLKEACPEIEVALPSDTEDLEELSVFTTRLAELSLDGDTETKTAIKLLDSATLDLRMAISQESGEIMLIAANTAWLDALDQMAVRCNAVGSSALQ